MGIRILAVAATAAALVLLNLLVVNESQPVLASAEKGDGVPAAPLPSAAALRSPADLSRPPGTGFPRARQILLHDIAVPQAWRCPPALRERYRGFWVRQGLGHEQRRQLLFILDQASGEGFLQTIQNSLTGEAIEALSEYDRIAAERALVHGVQQRLIDSRNLLSRESEDRLLNLLEQESIGDFGAENGDRIVDEPTLDELELQSNRVVEQAAEFLDREQLEVLGQFLQENVEFWEDIEIAEEETEFSDQDPVEDLPLLSPSGT